MPGAVQDAVLVTRPEGEAARDLCDQLEALGYAVAHQPLLELTAIDELPAEQRQRVLDLDLYQHVIFISANAVRFGMEYLQDYWPQWPVGLNWYAIGSATAARLARYDVRAITPGSDMTSEGLLAVPELASVAGERVLIVKGEGGRDKLASVLTGRGAQVDTLACYRRARPAMSRETFLGTLRNQKVGTILVTSGEGLAFLAELLSPQETSKLGQLNIIVPSARVAQQARDAGFTRVVTAANASDAAMLHALDQCHHSSGESE
ncbi:MAG: uroporphyrinogen-III synthase [Halioglobus sp.]